MIRIGNGGRIGAAFAFVLMAVVQLPGSSSSAQDAPADFVELNGVGAGEVTALMGAWAAPLFDSPGGVSLSYLPKGDKDSRLKFSRGENDFVLTGRPFNDEDKENLAARNVGVIEAPLAVSTMSFLLSGPATRKLSTVIYEGDPEDPDNQTQKITPWDGPVRIPSRLIGDALLDGPLSIWTDPELTANFDGLTLVTPQAQPRSVLRSDAGAMNYYTEQFLNTTAKPAYDAALAEYRIEPGVVSESWPLLTLATRAGDDNVAGVVGSGKDPKGDSFPPGGVLAPVSPAAARHQIELQAQKPSPIALYQVSVKNAAGEWVLPTPEAITIAAAAGNGAALPGLADPVPGAYPLTWITSIGAPTTGLSPEKTSALATFIRYAVTEGQNATALVGDGRLPSPLAQQALEAADRIVTSNCTGSDRTLVTVDGGGPFWPNGVAAPARSKLCNAVSTPGETTTTTTFQGPANTQDNLVTPPPTVPAPAYVPPATTPYVPPAPLADSPYSGDIGASDAVVESASETADTSPPTTAADDSAEQLKVSSVAAQLPLDLPGDGRFGLDRLVTAALGGAAFLFVRGLLRKRLGGATA